MEENSLFTVKSRLGSTLVRLSVFCVLLAAFWACTAELSNDFSEFDVQAGPAVVTLKDAARQAKVEFIFSTELVQGLQTPALKGEYTPIEAFNLLLKDSPLTVVQHEESGVFTIQRAEVAQNAAP